MISEVTMTSLEIAEFFKLHLLLVNVNFLLAEMRQLEKVIEYISTKGVLRAYTK